MNHFDQFFCFFHHILFTHVLYTTCMILIDIPHQCNQQIDKWQTPLKKTTFVHSLQTLCSLQTINLLFPKKALGQLGQPFTALLGSLPGLVTRCNDVDIRLAWTATRFPPTPEKLNVFTCIFTCLYITYKKIFMGPEIFFQTHEKKDFKCVLQSSNSLLG
jgi:hypothetical protein